MTRQPRAFAIDAGLALPVALAPGSTIADAQKAIAANCIAHLASNIAPMCEAGHPEALHQAHVATRRLRTMMRVFAPVVADAQSATWSRIDANMRQLGRRMGDVRDCELLLAQSDIPAAKVRHLRSVSATGRAAIRAALRDSHFRADLVSLLTLPGLRQAPLDLAAWAGAVLDRLFRQLRRAGDHLGRQQAEPQHRVRIRAKRLRYAMEFFASLYPCRRQRRRRRKLSARLGALQDTLGRRNDLATIGRVLGPGRGGSTAEHAALAAQAEKELVMVIGTKPFWR